MKKPETSNQKPEKILIKTPNWLGDSVMSIPAVIGIKRLFPDAEVWVWTKPGLMALWRFIPEVDDVIDSVPKKHNFDLGILLTNSFSSALRMYLAGVPERRGYSINGRRFLLTQPVPLKKGVHEIDYFLGVIDKVNVDSPRPDVTSGRGSVPQIDIPLELKEDAKRFLISHGWDGESDIIGIHATASYGPAKCWPKDRFSRLIDSLREWVLVIGGKEEKKDIDDILIKVHRRERIINLAGKTDIRMLSGVISLCRVFIANDSGPMHLAVAIEIPVVAVFGSTDPGRTGPRGKCIIIKKDVSCSPCLKRRCPKDLQCMKAIEVKDVLDAISGRGPSLAIRLAVVMKDYDEQRGGAERYLAGLVPALTKEVGSVDLVVNRVKGMPPAGVNIKTVKAIRWSSILEPLSFNWSVQRFLKRNRYDIVYGLTQIYPQDVYRVGGGLEHSWFEIRYKNMWQRLINYIRPRNIIRLYIENRIFTPPRCDIGAGFSKGNYKKIITNSNLCKYQILHHYRVSPEDIVVVYNGVDRNRFNPGVKALYRDKVRRELGIGVDDKVVLFISNNWKRKGLRGLIKATMPDRWLIVVGRGNERMYRKLAKGNRIRFIGTTTEPERYYGASDVFVLPTYYDPFANVCIEALSCGLPVVTTRLNGAAEFIVNGENGYVINDTDELAECIEKAFSLRGRISELTIEKNAKETINVFRKMDLPDRASHILVNDGYRDFLERQGRVDFDSIMDEKRGVIYKKNNLRSVVKIDNLFLKRHYKRASPLWAFTQPLRAGAGFREWQNIFRLRSIGIPTMEPIAVGEKGRYSFIITKSLEYAERLGDFVRSRRLRISEKMVLIHELASLTKQMHRNNLFHKDFYSGHIFVEKDGDRFKLYLIDLQRLCRHWLFKTRWCIKDLASLNFSSMGGFINNTDRLRFLRYYLGENYRGFAPLETKSLTGFIKKILAKTDRIARHTEKKLARREDLWQM